jgi:hypothetical protein
MLVEMRARIEERIGRHHETPLPANRVLGRVRFNLPVANCVVRAELLPVIVNDSPKAWVFIRGAIFNVVAKARRPIRRWSFAPLFHERSYLTI